MSQLNLTADKHFEVEVSSLDLSIRFILLS